MYIVNSIFGVANKQNQNNYVYCIDILCFLLNKCTFILYDDTNFQISVLRICIVYGEFCTTGKDGAFTKIKAYKVL